MCFTIQQIIGNSIEGNAINFAREIPIFVIVKHHVMEKNLVKICIWVCVNFRICRDLSPCGSLSHGVFFSVDLFFSRRRPVNITGAVAGSPRFHHMKTAKMFFNTPFQITIVRSYRAAMFVNIFKARTMFAPKSRAVKNPFGSFLNDKGCHHPFGVSAYWFSFFNI